MTPEPGRLLRRRCRRELLAVDIAQLVHEHGLEARDGLTRVIKRVQTIRGVRPAQDVGLVLALVAHSLLTRQEARDGVQLGAHPVAL